MAVADQGRERASKSEFDDFRNLLILDWSEAFLMSVRCQANAEFQSR